MNGIRKFRKTRERNQFRRRHQEQKRDPLFEKFQKERSAKGIFNFLN